MELRDYADNLAVNCRRASRTLRTSSAETRNQALLLMAGTLRSHVHEIMAANAIDLDAAKLGGLSEAMLDRLTLNSSRIEAMAKGVEEIAAFPDPLGKVLETRQRPNGMILARVTIPIGSVFFIYESRPNVTIDGAALCFKSGNSVVLRGGKESLYTSAVLAGLVRGVLQSQGLDPDCVQLVERTDRELVKMLLQRSDSLDLVIPRGGENLIRTVVEQSKIPVIKHYKGVCHVYIDASADILVAAAILENAKVQRPGVCNAMETVLFDKALDETHICKLLGMLKDKGVQIFGCSEICRIFGEAKAVSSMDQFHTEYLELKVSARMVSGVQGAMEHIDCYGSGHTDGVVAKNHEVQRAFVAGVDSSSVMVNVSTRFADGGEYGLGAEVGISTDKLHARGPMGVESLCTYKWVVTGDGQVRK